MNLKDLLKKRYVNDILITIILGIVSMILGFVKFYVPGVEGAASDMREIPLLIGVYHLSNPLYAIVLSAITSISTPSGIPFFPTFIGHVASLTIFWFFVSFYKKKRLSVFKSGAIGLLCSFIYFTVLIIPFIYLGNKIYGLYEEVKFIPFYKDILHAVMFEMFSTSFIYALYIVQDKIRRELKWHKQDLEQLVRNRTGELETANKELRSLNAEMFEKSNIIHNKNEELKTTLKQLKDTQASMIQIEKMASLGVLTAGVAHEINNPLNYIMGGYNGLKEYFKYQNCPDTDQINTLLHAIETGVDRASGIVRGLNQFSRNNDASSEKCDLHTIIDNCIAMINSQINHNIIIEKEYEKDLPEIEGNVGKLHQVFVNVLTNANQAVEDSGKIIIRSKTTNNHICIEIIDTGIGIDEDIIPKITDPFFTTKEPGKGTGLGLTISYNIIKEHKGDMKFESEKDKGTIVKILFPLY